MFINTITWKTVPLNMVHKNTNKYVQETNFILHYTMGEYIFNNIYGDEVKEQEQTCEVSAFLYITGGPTNNREYLYIKPKRHWRFGHETMLKHIKDGRVYKVKDKLVYKAIIKGNKQTNLFQTGSSRGEYPTQKPYKLLERVICISTL